MQPEDPHKYWPNSVANTQTGDRGVIFVHHEGVVTVAEKDLVPRVVFRGQSNVCAQQDFLCLGPIGSRSDYLTVTFLPELLITTGCFTGSLQQFIEEIDRKPVHQDRHKHEYRAAIELIKQLVVTRCSSEYIKQQQL